MPDFGIFRGFNDKLFGDKLYAGQLPINLGLIGSEEVRDFDIDAEAFFDRVTAAGGTLSITEQLAINTLVKQMKLDGIWTKMKAIYPMVGASAAACSQNLKSSSFTGSFSAGWTFASTGVNGNTSSTFMNTGFIPSAQLTTSSGHYSIYSRTNIDQSSIDLGVLTGAVHQILIRIGGNQVYSYVSTNLGIQVSNANSLGHYILNRNSATTTQGFKNGVEVASGLQTAGLPTEAVFIGARNQGGVPIIPSSRQFAFASMGDGLTDTEASDFYTAVQAFQTTLSRQV
jgi:hypothetical protein